MPLGDIVTKRRIFRNRQVTRWMTKLGVSDFDLTRSVREMERGLIDADLGHGILKKRIRLPGRGKRGGARVLLATNRGDRWFFLFGYAKNRKENITSDELETLKELGHELLSSDGAKVEHMIQLGELKEIIDDQNA